MRFVDRVRVLVRAGDGGRGVVAWRREALVPRGGPAGGDGGSGGSVILQADDAISTLLDLRFRRQYNAESGKPGSSKNRTGKAGKDLVLRVPVGTTVYFEGIADDSNLPDDAVTQPFIERDDSDVETVYTHEGSDAGSIDPATKAAILRQLLAEDGDLLRDEDEDDDDEIEPLGRLKLDHRPAPPPSFAPGDQMVDFIEPGESSIVAFGGKGGRGNVHFCTSTNRAPDIAESGVQGQAFYLRLELKLLADAGIVGFPNVGKSTLIRQISRARPEVADYPFTTLVPNLGVVQIDSERTMVVADIPGLIEGAAEGRGLGHEFLRHLERTRVLLHVLAPDPTEGRSPLRDLDVIEDELRRYGTVFENKPRVVAVNKIDDIRGRTAVRRLAEKLRERNIPLFPISAQSGEGVPALLEALWRRIAYAKSQDNA